MFKSVQNSHTLRRSALGRAFCITKPPDHDPGNTSGPLTGSIQRDQQTKGSMQEYMMSRKGLRPSFIKSTSAPPQEPAPARRVFNSKFARSPNQKFKGKKRPSRRDRDDGGSVRDIPDEMKAYVNDIDDFEEQFSKGKVIHDEEMDEFDTFCADMFMESIKTKDGKVHEVFRTEDFFKTKIPQPRTIRRLVDVSTPRINQRSDSEGYALGVGVWQVLSRNVTYTEGQKSHISNQVAAQANKLLADIDDIDEVDRLLDFDFREGLDGIEKDLLKEGIEFYDFEKIDQEATDWEVEAVVDEDSL